MTEQEIIAQANRDAEGLRDECASEGRDFVLLATDDWDSVAFAETGAAASFWPAYSYALRSAIRSMGGRA